MSLITLPFRVDITAGGKINYGFFIFTNDKVSTNLSSNDNSFNTGDACVLISSSFEPAFSLGTSGNSILDNDLVD